MKFGPTLISPMPLQKEGIRDIERFGGNVLLADDMGMGKTIQVLGSFRRNPGWLPAIVVCPASVKYNWQDEARKMGITADVCEGRKPPKSREIGHSSMLMIINFEILMGWMEEIRKLKFKTLVVDECQLLSKDELDRTTHVRTISTWVERTMGLSGTPLQNAPRDAYPMMSMIWPNRFRSFLMFARRYCDPKFTQNGWDYSGSSNRPELHRELIKQGMIRRTKDLLDLPPKRERVLPVELEDPAQYEEATEHFLIWLRKQDPTKVAKARKAEQLVQGGYLLRLVAELKIRAVIERTRYFLDNNPGKKIVLMGVHKKILTRLTGELSEYGFVQIDGDTPNKKRHALVQQFQNDPKTRGVSGNMKAAGVGINLTAASVLAFVELWWNPMQMAQAGDRVYRIGQKNPTTIAYLVARGTIEERLCRVIQRKLRIFREIIDDDDLEFEIYDTLMKEVLRDY